MPDDKLDKFIQALKQNATQNISDDDSLAREESIYIGNKSLEDVAKINQKIRKEEFKNIFHKCAKIVFKLLVLLASILIFIKFYHMVTPEQLHWLSEKQSDYIDTFFSGSLAALVIAQLKKYLD